MPSRDPRCPSPLGFTTRMDATLGFARRSPDLASERRWLREDGLEEPIEKLARLNRGTPTPKVRKS
jgi:hypothetical protein